MAINSNPLLQQRINAYATARGKFPFSGDAFPERFDPNYDKNDVAAIYSAALTTDYEDDYSNSLIYLCKGTYGLFFNFYNDDASEQIDYRVSLAEVDVTPENVFDLPVVDWHVVANSLAGGDAWGALYEYARITSRVTAIKIDFKADLTAATYDIQGVMSAV